MATDAAGAVAAAAAPLEDLLDDVNHATGVWLVSVIECTVVPSDQDHLVNLAQAVYDAGSIGYRVTSVSPLPRAKHWRRVLRAEATNGILVPHRYPAHPARSNADLQRAGQLADRLADEVEEQLGRVRFAGELRGEHVVGARMHVGCLGLRDLLLITDEWATVLSISVDD